MPIQESLHDILISATARSLALSLSLVKLSTLNSPCRGHLHADRGEEPLAYKHSPQREQSFGWRGAGLPLVLCPRPLHFLVSDCSRSDRWSVERIFFGHQLPLPNSVGTKLQPSVCLGWLAPWHALTRRFLTREAWLHRSLWVSFQVNTFRTEFKNASAIAHTKHTSHHARVVTESF